MAKHVQVREINESVSKHSDSSCDCHNTLGVREDTADGYNCRSYKGDGKACLGDV